jgi:hypothetical protein
MSKKMPRIDGFIINELIIWFEGEPPPLLDKKHYGDYYESLKERALPELRKIAARTDTEISEDDSVNIRKLSTKDRWNSLLSRVLYHCLDGMSVRDACAAVAEEFSYSAETVKQRWYAPANAGRRDMLRFHRGSAD